MNPTIIFIVPYRNREVQQEFFDKHMHYVMEDVPLNTWEIMYIHQKDSRSFNRGAIKNIGFLCVKEKYPDTYKNITLVFNDIDIMPIKKNFFDYATLPGIIKHFYGFRNTLGGIVSILGKDFEKIGGFPNFWAWGYEDNMLQIRVLQNHMQIDRSTFYPLWDKHVIMLHDGVLRDINRSEFMNYLQLTNEGFHSIRYLKYTTELVSNESTMYHVTQFDTGRAENLSTRSEFDSTKTLRPYSISPKINMCFHKK
jgi:hypothetical protein